ncbi:MAG: hypothetical protein K0S47_128 [Herbinix sp.]|jgi:hypothetical protein|nr:hypothetical protein [Herbinix sp.]
MERTQKKRLLYKRLLFLCEIIGVIYYQVYWYEIVVVASSILLYMKEKTLMECVRI